MVAMIQFKAQSSKVKNQEKTGDALLSVISPTSGHNRTEYQHEFRGFPDKGCQQMIGDQF
jgi:hypothetical protein